MSEQKKVAKSLQAHMTRGEKYTIAQLISLLPRTDYEFSEKSKTPTPTEAHRPRWNRWVRNAVRNSPDRTDHPVDWWVDLRAEWVGPAKNDWLYWLESSEDNPPIETRPSTFQVRVTDPDWLDHLASIEQIDVANFWTNSPNTNLGTPIVFVRRGQRPRKIAGWGLIESTGEMTRSDQMWDVRDANGVTTSFSGSAVAKKSHFMLLKSVELLGEFGPLETDVFNEENGFERFDSVTGPWKNYNQPLPELLTSSDFRGILNEREEIGAREGGVRYVRHRVIERNSRGLRNMKILLATANKGKIACEGCGLDMKKRYGFPEPIIDCHHLYPLSELDGREVRTELSDLALLCPSCHRAIHKQEDCSDLDELRRRLSESHTR